ncbi:glycoside hydrolase family 105 protein [Aaosphaeria arxii CBS 175.79]|uniref:Glycoside hydrolase family 105 protein n=1 Tax=Aaosphaeria arxii CBS 175.79 TaxID=1450172 RepID=A0A6A5Y8B4_9PLEO|nr:glycoside hydrolase family 105 protein [Aaosphaeria arxii CBS 175.79]KAF2021832.1 glycoside hydrolase family 105 protein [Aaosphaeria arxii CBS 175.79]
MSTLTTHGLKSEQIHNAIKLLTHNLINIHDTTGEFLLKLDDGRIIDTKGWDGWEWTHGIGLYGLYHYYTLTGDASTKTIMLEWFAKQLGKGTTKNINTMSPFLTLAYLYEDTGDKTYVPWLDTWAEWVMHGLPRTRYGGFQHETYNSFNKNELWDDTLMMSALPLAKIGLTLNRPEYVEEAKRQFLLHCQYLFDPTTGLFFHGWKFAGEEEEGLGHNFAKARWARGNSWLTIVIPDFVELLELKEGDPLRQFLLGLLDAQCRALKKHQQENGLWRTLIDVPLEEGSYEEASATAGFAYGMLKAVRKRYVGEEFLEPAVRAIKAVLGKINEEGELQDVSFGTAMGHDLKHYKDIPITSMPYGQAMAIMALGEFVRLYI